MNADQYESRARRNPFHVCLPRASATYSQEPDGLLYVLTDEDDGALLRIEPTGDF